MMIFDVHKSFERIANIFRKAQRDDLEILDLLKNALAE